MKETNILSQLLILEKNQKILIKEVKIHRWILIPVVIACSVNLGFFILTLLIIVTNT